MKKYFYVLAFFIFAFMPFKVNASYMPPALPQNGMVPDFMMSVAQTQIATDTGYYSNYKPDYNALNEIVNGRTIPDSMKEVYIDNATIAGMGDFVNGNLQTVPAENTYTCYGSSDIGMYSYVADKTTGEILYIDFPNETQSTLQYMGESMPVPEAVLTALHDLAAPTLANYRAMVDLIDEAKFHQRTDIYSEDDLTQAQKDFLANNDFHFYMHSNNQGFDVYVANGCTTSCVIKGNGAEYHGVVSANQMGAPDFYSTTPSIAKFVNNSNTYGYMVYSPVYYFGRTWDYCPRWMNVYNVLGSGGYLDYKSPTEAQFNTMVAMQNDVVQMQPIEVTNNYEGDTINYTSITNRPPEYHTTVNNNYNYINPVTPDNYPVNNTVTYPDYSTHTTNNNNYVEYIYNYYTTPNTGENVGNITDPILPENIPILSNLEFRFPFSIPFDMYKLLKGLSVPRETPIIDTTIIIPRVNYEWNIYYDMAPFDDIARLFRTLFLISYIIGLAYFSYDHFFGS